MRRPKIGRNPPLYWAQWCKGWKTLPSYRLEGPVPSRPSPVGQWFLSQDMGIGCLRLLWGGCPWTWEDAGRTKSQSRVRWSLGASETAGHPAPRHRTSGTIRDHQRTRGRAARWNAGTWPSGGPRRGLSVRCTFICFHILAEGAWVALDDALEPPTAACWLRGRMSGVRSWSVHDSPCPLGTQRQRQPLPVEIFETTDYPPGPPGEGEMHLPSPEAVPSLSGSPVPRPLAPLLTASWRGPGRAGRPAYT